MNKTQKPKPVMNRTLSVLLAFGLLNFASAQNYTHQAKIDSIKNDGMHRLELSPRLRAFAKVDMSDIRILDANRDQVPYLILNEPIANASTAFIEYKIIDRQIKNNKHTKLIIENTDNQPITNVSVCIANTSVRKVCKISGSNDLKQWYAVSDDQELSSLYDNTRTTIYKSIYFPSVAYRYYQLFINDSNSAPLNISKAGYFKGSTIGGKMLEITPVTYTIRNDSKTRTTRISVSLTGSQLIDHIAFKITEPRYYKRHFKILADRKKVYKKRTEEYTETLYESELSSDIPAKFDVPGLIENEFIIEIENLDNPPLKIAGIKFEQLAASLIADFKAGKKYTLVMGDKDLQMPKYDLDYFRDKISALLPVARLGEIEPILKTPSVPGAVPFWQQKWFMWLCVLMGALIIFFFSFSLLKDMQSKKES